MKKKKKIEPGRSTKKARTTERKVTGLRLHHQRWVIILAKALAHRSSLSLLPHLSSLRCVPSLNSGYNKLSQHSHRLRVHLCRPATPPQQPRCCAQLHSLRALQERATVSPYAPTVAGSAAPRTRARASARGRCDTVRRNRGSSKIMCRATSRVLLQLWQPCRGV